MSLNQNEEATTLISIASPCYNEEENVERLREEIERVFSSLPNYRYELIFIDNHSTDRTVEKIKAMANVDHRIKLIVNARNFGHVRSPHHAFLQAHGAAVIIMASDLQDPPELIPQFIAKWEAGYKIAIAVKTESQESGIMWLIRCLYYKILHKIADIDTVENYTGYGLYDKKVVEIIRTFHDPYPYFRGIISEIGFERAEIPFKQHLRKHGITKNNFYTLYDTAMLGITSYSKVPIRLATMSGFLLAGISLFISIVYLTLKMIFWNEFGFGLAPLLIGIFFFSSIQLFFIGLLGEYIAAIHTQVMNRPHVIEKERINFEKHE